MEEEYGEKVRAGEHGEVFIRTFLCTSHGRPFPVGPFRCAESRSIAGPALDGWARAVYNNSETGPWGKENVRPVPVTGGKSPPVLSRTVRETGDGK